MKHIIAIGGGGFGRNPGEGLIEQYILDQTGKDLPNICFIPTATGDNEAYKVNYYSTFSKLHCNPVHLDFFKRTPDLEKLIDEQDAIFVGVAILRVCWPSGKIGDWITCFKKLTKLELL